MKALVKTMGGQGNDLQRLLEKQQAANIIRARGSARIPDAPRDIQVQKASRGVYVSWKLPEVHDVILGWRIYLNTENNLVRDVRDKGTRQVFIPLNAGATPPTYNIFVCSYSALGRESELVLQQGKAQVEAGAPTVPTASAGYLEEKSGGGDRSLIRFRGDGQYQK